MIPQIKAKYRIKDDVPFTIEKVVGIQYRCLLCNKIFYKEKELQQHILRKNTNCNEHKNSKTPKHLENINVSIIYTEDIVDKIRQKNFVYKKRGT